MSLPFAHLLTLPRELRDKIYEYLHQTIEFDWKWKITRCRRVVVNARLDKAPLLSLLLTCTRLHDEYREMDFVKDLSVVMEWDTSTIRVDSQKKAKRDPHMTAVFTHVRYATLVAKPPDWGRIRWDEVARLFEFLKSKKAKITSIRVLGQFFHARVETNAMLNGEHPYAAALQSPALPPTPNTLAGLSLNQIGEGYHIGFGDTWTRYQGITYIFHRIDIIGIYLYTLDKPDDYLWGPTDVLEQLSLLHYPKEILEMLPTSQAETITAQALRVLQWEEKRGEDVKTWRNLVHVQGSGSEQYVENNEGFAPWFE